MLRQRRCAARSTLTARKAPGESEAVEPWQKRRNWRINEIGKIVAPVQAESPAIQLVLPDAESRKRDGEEQIDACVKQPYVRSVELLVSDIS